MGRLPRSRWRARRRCGQLARRAREARRPAIATWQWKAEPGAVRHMGAMAQDFQSAFGLGDSDKPIVTFDADGVALAAIQGTPRRTHCDRGRAGEEARKATDRIGRPALANGGNGSTASRETARLGDFARARRSKARVVTPVAHLLNRFQIQVTISGRGLGTPGHRCQHQSCGDKRTQRSCHGRCCRSPCCTLVHPRHQMSDHDFSSS